MPSVFFLLLVRLGVWISITADHIFLGFYFIENGSVGVSDHEDHVARLIHRRLDIDILDVAGGSSEVIAISSKGEVMSWSEPLTSSDSSSDNDSRLGITSDDSLQARFNLKDVKPSELHPLQDFNKDQAKAETEVLAFFDTQKRGQPKQIRLVEALFESSRLVVEKPGLSKCVAQYDRFTIC